MSLALQNQYRFIFKTALMSLLHSNRELEMNRAEVLGENDSFAVCCCASTSRGTNKYIYVAYISKQRGGKYKQQFSILLVLQTAVLIYELRITVNLAKEENISFLLAAATGTLFLPAQHLSCDWWRTEKNTNAGFSLLFKYPQLF